MNKSLVYGSLSVILLFGTYFFLTRIFSHSEQVIYYAGLGLGILVGIAAFVKGIGEIKRKENKPQAVLGLILGLVTGILPPLAWLVGMALIIVGGPH